MKNQGVYNLGIAVLVLLAALVMKNAGAVAALMLYIVAVAAYGVGEGLPGSVKAPIVVDEEKTHSYTISVANNALIQDKSKLSVAAFIIDKTDGRVVNAAIVPVEGYELGINDALTSNGNRVVSRYSIDGRRLTAPQRGLNIIKTADGHTMKVVVR